MSTSSSKHAPARWRAYLDSHEGHLQRLLEEGFIQEHRLAYESVAGHIIISGQMACLGSIVITIEKLLAVFDPNVPPLDVRVQTIIYAYNASIRGWDNFLRYDNTHPHPGHADDHHRHRMDWRTGKELPGSPEWVGEAGWPVLAEFVREVESWFRRNEASLPGGVPELDDPYVRRLFSELE